MWCFRAHLYLNCYLPLCDLHGRVGMAPSYVWEVWFSADWGKNEAEKVFLTHGREYGFKCAGGLQVMWCFTVPVFFLPSTIAWPVPPTLHVFFLKVKVVLVWKEHLKSQTFFWKQSKILHIALKGAPLINHHHIKINAVLSNKNRGLTCLEVLLLLWILGCSYLHGMTDYFPIS